ncbi:NAD(P)-binding protein [Micromonospora endolithica]|uniref:NAD(P)-binding protein n=1 Tax=Micromonospora endolithica TaxID=230091 RepID=UPI001EDF7A02|nr:FAD/NAD(P)-binding protein [Micromonospora endolithica]
MTHILVPGAGPAGLTTAMLLARDGHQVTLLERDPAPPPVAPAATAWDHWRRHGVNQFHLPHFILPRWWALVGAERGAPAGGRRAPGGRRSFADQQPGRAAWSCRCRPGRARTARGVASVRRARRRSWPARGGVRQTLPYRVVQQVAQVPRHADTS